MLRPWTRARPVCFLFHYRRKRARTNTATHPRLKPFIPPPRLLSAGCPARKKKGRVPFFLLMIQCDTRVVRLSPFVTGNVNPPQLLIAPMLLHFQQLNQGQPYRFGPADPKTHDPTSLILERTGDSGRRPLESRYGFESSALSIFQAQGFSLHFEREKKERDKQVTVFFFFPQLKEKLRAR